MIEAFRQSKPSQIVIILMAVAALWARAFVMPVAPEASHSFAPIYEWLYGWLAPTPRLASGVALLLVLGEGILLNVLLYSKKVISTPTLFPLFLYVVAMSAMPGQLTLTPVLLVNLMLLGVMSQLLTTGSTKLSFDLNFNASFFLGLAAMCYLPALAYLVPMMFIFVVYKMYRWRDIVVSMLGFIAPLFVLGTYAFLTDRWVYYLFLIRHDLGDLGLRLGDLQPWTQAYNALFLLLLVVILVHQLFGVNRNLNVQRINTGVMALPLLGSALVLLYSTLFPVNTQLTACTFAYLATFYFLAERRRKWLMPLLLWLWLVLTVANVWIS
ncbi:MAG: hypothetical protein K5864_00615 [Bacteroidales bacterium]|nr:hypothetical protein [Bacteroidales bacterium]